MKREGLGRLPSHLSSVGSLLLFNTKENPYKEYAALDNLATPAWAVVEKKCTCVSVSACVCACMLVRLSVWEMPELEQ